MVAYFILLTLTLLLCVLGCLTKNRMSQSVIFVILCCTLIIFSGFRFNVGVDYPNYVGIFYSNKSDVGVKEPGFLLLMKFIRAIGGNVQMLFAICALITQFFIFFSIKKLSKNLWLSLIVYVTIGPFYLSSFNGIRQFAAIGLFYFSLYYLTKSKYICYIIINIIAGIFFHASVIVVAFVSIFLLGHFKKITKLLIIVINLMSIKFIDYLIQISPYAVYLKMNKPQSISSVTYLFVLIAFAFILFESRIKPSKNKELFLNLNFLSLLTVLVALLVKNGMLTQMFLRMNSYFFFVYILLIPEILQKMRYSYQYFCKCLLLLICIMYYFRAVVITGEKNRIVPYQVRLELFEQY